VSLCFRGAKNSRLILVIGICFQVSCLGFFLFRHYKSL